jgi:hypothetical protein
VIMHYIVKILKFQLGVALITSIVHKTEDSASTHN